MRLRYVRIVLQGVKELYERGEAKADLARGFTEDLLEQHPLTLNPPVYSLGGQNFTG